MDIRHNVRRYAPCGLIVLAAGCTDPMLGLEKPSAEPTLRLATQPSGRSGSKAVPSTKGRRDGSAQSAATGDSFILYLVDGKIDASTGPYAKAAVLRRADPAKAVSLLDWLTEPSGHGGSKDRQFLIYGDSTFLDWSIDLAATIDVRAAGSQPSVSKSGDGLAQALATFYAGAGPSQTSQPEAEVLVKGLEAYAAKPGDPHRRWTAYMLAGRLLADVIGTANQAVTMYDRAAHLAQPSSPAWLVSRYRQAAALDHSGRRAEARMLAKEIVKESSQRYTRARAYRQAEKLAAGPR